MPRRISTVRASGMVLPMTAVDYIVVVLLAQLLLAEVITPIRWVGIVLITVGVLMVWRT